MNVPHVLRFGCHFLFRCRVEVDSDSLPKSLHLIFNTIANKCYFPSFWKTSEIIPIFKEGNKQMVDNYRPISLLVAVSKVLEKLIFDRMYPILSTALSQSQHGFRQRRSSITNLIEYLHKMFVNFDNSNCHFLASFYLLLLLLMELVIDDMRDVNVLFGQ